MLEEVASRGAMAERCTARCGSLFMSCPPWSINEWEWEKGRYDSKLTRMSVFSYTNDAVS